MLHSRKRRWIHRLTSPMSRSHQNRRRATRRLFTESLERRVLLTVITSLDPAANSFAAAASTDVSATFDQNVTAATDQTFVVHSSQRGQLVGGATTVSTAGMTATHNPTDDFFPGEFVQATVTSGVTTAGGAAVKSVWQFRTQPAAGSGQLVNSGQSIGNASNNVPSQGVEIGDLDGDGDLDAFVANNGVGNRVYLNSGGVFTDSGQTLGSNQSQEVALGDLDGDGDLDAVVANFAGEGNRVWQNDGSGNFSETQSLADNDSGGVQLGDLDGDGDLDAFITNGDGYGGQGNRVWLNAGGTLSDSGQSIGNETSWSVELGDLDSDGDLDAFVVNDGGLYGGGDLPNRIYLNDGSGSFSSNGQSLGPHASASVDLGDVDGDGDLDAFVANTEQDNRLYLNDGSGLFTDTGQLLSRPGSPLGNRYTRTDWIELGDLDADGDLDAFTANDNGGPNRIWRNDGAGVFTDSGQDLWLVPGGSFLTNPPTSAVALGDVDGDGDLDAFTVNDAVGDGTPSVARVWINQNLTPSVTLGIDSTTIAEAAGVATVTATLSAAHSQVVTVNLGTSGTATETDDFTISGNQIAIPVGATSGSVTITAVQDAVDEPDETVIVDVTSITNAQEAGTQQVTATILDDDEAVVVPDVTLSLDNSSIPEADGVATFTATLSEVTTVPVTIDLGISGTAAATDFTASGTQIVVAAGATSGSITVTAVQDEIDESDETVIVDVTNVTGGTESGSQQQTTTITDDDDPPEPDVSLAVDNAEIAEAGGVATFVVTLSETTTVAVTVDLEITGTAAAGDYNASGTQIIVAPGATTGSITVTAVDDTEDESNETVVVDIAAVTGGNEAGEQQQTTTITDDDDPPKLTVTELTPTESGFIADFNIDLNTSVLNLYDTQSGGLGPADVTLQGASTGAVAGSLVVDPSLRKVTFIKSGDPLAPDTYTVTLRSAVDGFVDGAGQLLDGNDDGTEGDDYSSDFAVEEPAANSVTIGIPDFVRGPGQDVNLPADVTTGIPVTISEGTNVRAVDLRVAYDPNLLTITGAIVGPDAPGGAAVIVNTTTPGLAILVFFSTNPLPAGIGHFVDLQATVPTADASGIYGVQQVLDVHSVIVSDGNDNEAPAVVDDALHVASFFADVSGNGRVNAADASGVARFAALIDGGFAGSPNGDPLVVGDISGNGRLNAADASLLAQFAALIDVPQIPAIPAGVTITGIGGPDLTADTFVSPGATVEHAPSANSDDASGGDLITFDVLPDHYIAVDKVLAELENRELDLDEADELTLTLEAAVDQLLSE
jgi:hypothetical protein